MRFVIKIMFILNLYVINVKEISTKTKQKDNFFATVVKVSENPMESISVVEHKEYEKKLRT